jgi:hypothetical protein
MTTHAHPDPWSARRRTHYNALAFAAFALMIGAILTQVTDRRSERATIEQLPAGERQALYERTLQTLSTTCSEPVAGLDKFCREQADFIVQFPECDNACVAMAQRHRSQATR